MKEKQTRVVMWALILIILALVLVMVYAFVVRPSITGYVSNQQMVGYQYGQIDLLNGILSQLQQSGYVEIPAGQNQTVFLMPFDPQMLQQQTEAAQ
jgi:hypothetical protein